MTDKAQHFFQIYKTVLQLLDKRGYNVSPAALNMTLEEFRKEKGDSPRREDLFNVFNRKNALDTTDQIMVFFVANSDDPSKALVVKDVTE